MKTADIMYQFFGDNETTWDELGVCELQVCGSLAKDIGIGKAGENACVMVSYSDARLTLQLIDEITGDLMGQQEFSIEYKLVPFKTN